MQKIASTFKCVKYDWGVNTKLYQCILLRTVRDSEKERDKLKEKEKEKCNLVTYVKFMKAFLLYICIGTPLEQDFVCSEFIKTYYYYYF